MPMIHNSIEYAAIMRQVSANAMEVCLDKARADLQKAMLRDVYSAYSPQDYLRTYQLLDAWRGEASALRGSIMFMSGLLGKNPDQGQHTSIMGDGSLGDALLDVLEAGYQGFNANKGRAIPARPFWDKWIQNRASRYIGAWYRDGLEAQGFTVTGR